MKLHYDEQTEAFRAELSAWLEANRPTAAAMAEDPSLSSAHEPAWAREWQRRLFDEGWLVPGWPPELGGRNASAVQQMVYFEEMARQGLPRSTNPQGLSIVAPSILEFGSADLKRRYAMPVLRAELTACLGMSEPGAGSDLAGLSTRAEVHDDHFLLSGQKVWTSGAHHADFCFCFCRTDPDAPKHRGISVIIVDMGSPGVSFRPLPQLVGEDHPDFNEVFFDEVTVPRENLVGQLNQGWTVGNASLTHERAMMWTTSSALLDSSIDALVRQARELGNGRWGVDALLADELARLYVDTQALRFLGYRGFAKFARGQASPEHSILKVLSSETSRRLNLVGAEMVGADGGDMGVTSPAPRTRPGADMTGMPWAQRYLFSFGNTIAGGTSEIQRNIIAERVLGLPRA